MESTFEEKLRGLTSPAEIEKVLHELCRPYGGVRDLRLLPDGTGGQYCYFMPATPAHRITLFYALDALFYADGMMFKVP